MMVTWEHRLQATPAQSVLVNEIIRELSGPSHQNGGAIIAQPLPMRIVGSIWLAALGVCVASCSGEVEATGNTPPGTDPTQQTSQNPGSQPTGQDPNMPAAPVGCAGSATCVSFDDGKLPSAWSVAGQNPAPVVDQTRAHSGTYALHFKYTGGDGYKPYIKTTTIPSQSTVVHVRYYYYMTGYAVYYGTALALNGNKTDNSLARYTQNFDNLHPNNTDENHFLAAYAENSQCAWQNEDTHRAVCANVNANCTSADVMAAQMPLNKWTCVEATFDGATGKPTVIEVNGNALKLYADSNPWPTVTKWTSLEVGFQECHIFGNREVWLDDIAVSNAPIGCD